MDYSAAHFLVTKYIPMKIRRPPATINRLNSSQTKIIANKAVTRGSANKEELATAAPA